MAKRKTGLHRKVSSIFDGLSVPKPGVADSDESGGGRTDSPSEGKNMRRQDGFVSKDVPIAPKRPKIGGGKEILPAGGGGLAEFASLGVIGTVSNKRRRTTMVLMVVLFVVLLLVLTSTFSRSLAKKKLAGTLEQADTTAQPATARGDVQIDWEKPPKYPETLRDPMDTTWRQDPVTGEWAEEAVVVVQEGDDKTLEEKTLIDVGIALRSILWAETGRSIAVGNEILYEGDEIMGVTVKKINKDSVEFEKDGVGFLKVFPR
ncbi:MAG: hypothetical protein DRP65_02795 [Planctomycetota bacterium]|nr:MAG: hypothetical protein DRP65_02795 [Planctomycetota bacterium]